MKKALILTRFRGEYEPKRLREEAEKLGYEVDVIDYARVRLSVSEKNEPVIDLGKGRRVEDYEVIVPRAATGKKKQSMTAVKTIIIAYAKSLGEKGPRVLNGETFAKYPLMGKLEQGVMLSKHNLPVVPFESFYGGEDWRSVLKHFPLMVKMRFGSHGMNVKLVENQEELSGLKKKYSAGTVLIQPVIKIRRWYRVIVLNGEVVGLMKHKQKRKYQVKDGRKELRMSKPVITENDLAKLKEISVKACKVFEVDFAGLDVAWDEDAKDWKILEINRTAQFYWFERAYPELNIARRLILGR